METNDGKRALSIILFAATIVLATLLGWLDGTIVALFVNVASTLTLDWKFFLQGISFIEWCEFAGAIAGVFSMLYILLPYLRKKKAANDRLWKAVIKGLLRGLIAGIISFSFLCLAILVFVRHGWIFNLTLLGIIYVVPKWILIGVIAYPVGGRLTATRLLTA